MLTQKQIDQFYKDVEALGLKYPVAAIAEKTGYSKGNVSSYLSKKSPPSENFINAFYNSFKVVPRETSESRAAIQVPGDMEKILRDYEERLLRTEAHLEVYESVIATLWSESKNDFTKKLGELRELVQAAAKRRLAELREKHG